MLGVPMQKKEKHKLLGVEIFSLPLFLSYKT